MGFLTQISTSLSTAVTSVQLKDDRNAKSLGFDLIYEARDLDLPQNVRDGLTQARSSIEDTKSRVIESKKRLTQEVLPYIEKAYWTEAKESLRLQVGTLRFDLNTLASARTASERRAALASQRRFLSDIEKVDFAIREKKMTAAINSYKKSLISLEAALENVL